MTEYKLVIWWWYDSGRTSGGDYPFTAPDDKAAIEYAVATFDEQIGIADQSSIFHDDRLVWENQWPIRDSR